MTAIDLTSVHQAEATVPAGRASLAGRAAKLWLAIAGRLDAGGAPSQLLRLNDHLLRDMGKSRTGLEVEAIYWPFRAPVSHDLD